MESTTIEGQEGYRSLNDRELGDKNAVKGVDESGIRGRDERGEIEIPRGFGTVYFSAPNFERREQIKKEAADLYPEDDINRQKYRCAKFWNEVQLDKVELVQSDSKP